MPLVTRNSENARVWVGTSAPATPSDGDIFSDQTNDKLQLYDGSSFNDVGTSSFSAAATVSYSETIGDYTQPTAGVATSEVNNGITKDAQADNDTSTSGTTLTISSFTVANNSNRLLIVCAGSYNTTQTISGITWNGSENLTQAVTVLNQSRSDIWYLVAPTATTADVVITWSGTAGRRSGGVYSFYNCEQSSPLGVTNTATGTGTTVAGTITPTTTNSMIVDSVYSLAGETITDTLTAGWVNFINGDDRNQGSQYDLSPTISSANAMEYTSTNSQYSWVGAEFKGIGASLIATKAIDDDTATYWKSNAETNPAIYVDCGGSATNLLGCAIYLENDTTETEIKIRCSTDTSFADGENTRTITVSNLTAGAWNYIRWNLVNARYMQIYGSSGSSVVLAISEIKYLTKTDSQILQDLGIIEISTTDTSIGLDGV